MCVYTHIIHTYMTLDERSDAENWGILVKETPNNIIFLATTSTIPICTPHSLLEWRESGDHRGMYGVQIRVFFLVPDFAFIGVLWTSFLFNRLEIWKIEI